MYQIWGSSQCCNLFRPGYRILIVFLLCLWLTLRADAALVVQIGYSGEASYEPVFSAAAETWQSLLTGYQDGQVVNRSVGSTSVIGEVLGAIVISASVQPIDGVGNTLGRAGFTQIAVDESGYRLATDGIMQFDSADVETLSSAELNRLVLHEMAHVLGFGTLWEANGVYVNGSGEFTGANATAAWLTEFGQSGTPDVELSGAAGTANGHWNEPDGGGSLSGITDQLGRDMTFELMTGWLNNGAFISDLTVGSFRDIGFTTANATAVPEPGTGGMLVAGLVAAMGWRRRSQVMK